jgi:hypothetical protein
MHTEPRPGLLRGALWGAAAGAAATTALDAVSYLDMAWRGRAPSTTPEASVTRLEEVLRVQIPGAGEVRQHRIAALGSLMGTAAGVSAGAALGAARAAGWRPGPVASIVAATMVALVVGNGPMTILGVTDPRQWSAVDWVSDVVPHVAYGVVAGLVLARCA